MTESVTQRSAKEPLSNNVDDIAGIGGGMLLLELARNLPDTSVLKSWLIIIAPALTLVIRWLWSTCVPEMVFAIKQARARETREKLLTGIDLLLKDPDLSEKRKIKLRAERECVKIAIIEELSERLSSFLES